MLLGSLMLYDVPESGLRVSWLVIVPTVGATAGRGDSSPSRSGLRALYRPPTTGARAWWVRRGVVKTALDPEGQVLVDGELWRSGDAGRPGAGGEHVEIVSVDGLTLTVVKSARRA